MKLLLDSHIWIWSQLTPERLKPKVAAALADGRTELWISAVTVWEVILLSDSGRLALRPDPIQWIRRTLAIWDYREAPLTHEIALASRRLDLAHDDPADRFLVATAKVLDLTLVTADERLLACKQIALLPNR